MVRAALGFFVLALMSILYGVTGAAGVSLETGSLLLLVFLVLSVLSLASGLAGRGAAESKKSSPAAVLADEQGRIGYILAWLLGVPVWVLFLIFLVRGH